MKVLYLINYAGSGGSERYVELLARYFHGKTCSCGLCYNEHGGLVEKMDALGIPTHQLTMNSPLDIAAAKALADLCRREGYDVVHAQYPRENYIAILSRAFGNRAKIIFTSHLIIHQPQPWKLLNRVFTPQNHRIITVCSHGREVLEQNGVAKNKIQIVFNGVDAAAQPRRDKAILSEFGIGEHEPVLSILTRFSEEKGTPFLLRSIAKLKETTALPFRVLIVGTGPDEEAVRSLAAELDILDRVIFTGFRSDTAAILAASDIYLNTSRSEAMSFAILEALGAGLPLVATDVGGNPELVNTGNTCGILVPYGDTDACAAAMQKLLEDRALRAEYGAAARRKAEQEFNLVTLLEEIYQIYQL